ncbi:hypothetical protein I7X12_07180 [Halosimplex litoreum]|uniref:DUF7978 domain-containing protein n=1 Tax=Halosimplex litoreum TaxID=1198301 RepID=A0A7T3G1U4_9EURY|nr:hypothetical protein [Halosimplex litoreum]QPV64388.1 hypothetical protein I7X12_07180 [Halosimplex litoreum]
MSLADREARLRARLTAAAPGRETVVFGSLVGFCAFLVGYAATFLSERHRIRDPTRPVLSRFGYGVDAGQEITVGPDGALPSAWRFAAWQYHQLHGVRLDPWFGAGGNVAPPSRPLVIVPALVLAAAGFLLVARTRADDPWVAASRGGLVAAGYAPLAVGSARLSAWAAPETVRIVISGLGATTHPLGTVEVPLGPAVALTGLVVPVAFGALGGYLAFAWRGGEWPRSLVARGAVAGVAAFAVGWAAVRRATERRLATEGPGPVQAVGAAADGEYTGIAPGAVDPGLHTLATWQFHRVHGGSMAVRYRRAVTDGVDAVRVFDLAGIVPVVPAVLLLAGAALVYSTGEADGTTAALRGGAVAVGYLPLAAATALLSAWTPPAAPDLVLAVSLLDAVQRTGLVYPVTFGAVGGLVGFVAVVATGHVRRALSRVDPRKAG